MSGLSSTGGPARTLADTSDSSSETTEVAVSSDFVGFLACREGIQHARAQHHGSGQWGHCSPPTTCMHSNTPMFSVHLGTSAGHNVLHNGL